MIEQMSRPDYEQMSSTQQRRLASGRAVGTAVDQAAAAGAGRPAGAARWRAARARRLTAPSGACGCCGSPPAPGFDFEVLVDRGFDIGRAWLGGRPLAWWSPVGLIGPWYYEPSGIGWFRGFTGGLVSTCGLDHTLLGGTDDARIFNYPHRQTETYGLHGRYTGLPGPARRIRHDLARRRLRALGGSRGRPDGGLRRAAGAEPPDRGRPRRDVRADKRHSDQRGPRLLART